MKTLPLNEVCDYVMGQAPPSETYNDKGEGTLFIRQEILEIYIPLQTNTPLSQLSLDKKEMYFYVL